MAANLFPGRARIGEATFDLAMATDAASRARALASVDHQAGYELSVDHLLGHIDCLTRHAAAIRRDRAAPAPSNRAVNPSTRDAANA